MYLSQIMKLNLPEVCTMQACSLFSPGKYSGMYWISSSKSRPQFNQWIRMAIGHANAQAQWSCG